MRSHREKLIRTVVPLRRKSGEEQVIRDAGEAYLYGLRGVSKGSTRGVRVDVWMRENVSQPLKRLPEVQACVFRVIFQKSSHAAR